MVGGIQDLFQPDIGGHALDERSEAEDPAPEHLGRDSMECSAGRVQYGDRCPAVRIVATLVRVHADSLEDIWAVKTTADA